jgi:hypothetical protein
VNDSPASPLSRLEWWFLARPDAMLVSSGSSVRSGQSLPPAPNARLSSGGASNQLRPVDQKAVYGAFKASGSYDPDALYAHKEAMLAPYKRLKLVACFGAFVGGLLSLTIATTLVGVPTLVASWLLWRFQARQSFKIEAAYGQYVGAPAASSDADWRR